MNETASAAGTAPSAVERTLALDRTDDDTFTSAFNTRRLGPRLFGGQVAAQALVAACSTVPDGRPPHSLHAYFVRPGTPLSAVRYDVNRVRDGRSFSTRHVTARQGDETILEFLASFEIPEEGPDWQTPPPELGAVPPTPTASGDVRLGHLAGLVELRPETPPSPARWRLHPFWVRTSPPVGDDATVNAAMLTYVSDIALMANARAPGTTTPMSAVASIDHAVWFHRPPRLDQWLFYSAEPIANIGARGTVRGAFHTQEGRLVATVLQEALLRPDRSHRFNR